MQRGRCAVVGPEEATLRGAVRQAYKALLLRHLLAAHEKYVHKSVRHFADILASATSLIIRLT